jgi:methionyl-tRNA synthetase
MEKLVVSIKCPYCRKSLMDEKTQIDGYPSVKVQIQYGNKDGSLYLSSIYGSYNIITEVYIPNEEIVLFFCPYCHASLLLKDSCEKCQAPLAFFELKNGGKVQICSRRGCKYHSIDYSNLSQKISALYSVHEVFADPSRIKQKS